MKTNLSFYAPIRLLLLAVLGLSTVTSCIKEYLDHNHGGYGNNSKATKTYPAVVAIDWLTLHAVKLTRSSPGYNSAVSMRSFAYTGLTLYESVVPGMKGYHSLGSQLNDLVAMPGTDDGSSYHWPTCANTALASMTRNMFVQTSDANKSTIDSLESAHNDRFMQEVSVETFERSRDFGRQIANAIYEWSRTDGAHEAYLHNTNDDYIPPVGEGLWIPTPPTFAKPLQPYWGNNRPFIADVVGIGERGAPPAYSEADSSIFYLAAKEVYTVSKSLSEEQIATAKYWNDSPVTYNGPGHATNILTQILLRKKENLAGAAVAYAKHAIAMNDALISCFYTKYKYNLIRPVSYINKVIDPGWNPLINKPPHPEYTSAHANVSAASAEVMKSLFGKKYAFTDSSYESFFGVRHYASFDAYANEAALSRLYGGIHYRFSCENGLVQGKKVGQAVNRINIRR